MNISLWSLKSPSNFIAFIGASTGGCWVSSMETVRLAATSRFDASKLNLLWTSYHLESFNNSQTFGRWSWTLPCPRTSACKAARFYRSSHNFHPQFRLQSATDTYIVSRSVVSSSFLALFVKRETARCYQILTALSMSTAGCTDTRYGSAL